VIQAALNGKRTRAEHPAIPLTPEQLAESAKESVTAGAGSIHFHVRAGDARESLAPEDVAGAVAAIRGAVAGTSMGISTGAWILNDARSRQEMISRWRILPDFASVNFNEEGAVTLAELLLSRGIGVEAGLSDLAGTQIFLKSGLKAKCLRMLIEPFEPASDSARKTFDSIDAALDEAGVTIPRLMHGMNEAAWRMIDIAAERGYDTRVGFEDVLTLPDGSLAAGNAELVAEAARRVRHRQGR
jgi:uncharacterized protein (DUF849 family)